MGNCLVTKLKGIVQDEKLLKLGEIRFGVHKVSSPSVNTQYCRFTSTRNQKINIVGGHLTDSNLTQNDGNQENIIANQPYGFIISNDDSTIILSDKYALTNITSYAIDDFDLSSIKYCKELQELILLRAGGTGDLKDLSGLSKLTNLTLKSEFVTGDISSIINLPLTTLQLVSSLITGDIAILSGKELSVIGIEGTNISGSINNLTFPSIGWFTSNTSITGDIGTVTFNTEGSKFNLNGNVNLGCDLSNVKNLIVISNGGKPSPVFTWGSGTPSYILAMEGITMEHSSDVDNMLNKQATLSLHPNANDVQEKKIDVYCPEGRTSVSDSAITTLQGKGVTVSIRTSM